MAVVEDLYRPYRPKRRTRATIAREKGLEPLAALIRAQNAKRPIEEEAKAYLSKEKEVHTVEEAVAGAKDILAEQISEEAEYRIYIRDAAKNKGVLQSSAKDKEAKSVYEMYYDFQEPAPKLAGHRVMALNRGEKEKMLTVKLAMPEEEMLRYLDRLSDEEASALEKEGAEEWSILRPRAFYYMENASEGRFIGNEEQYEAALKWNAYMPMVETCARFTCLDPSPCLESIGQWDMGLRIDRDVAERLDIFLNKAVRLVEPKKCLVYYVREERKRNLGDPKSARGLILERPLDICRRHGFHMAGDIYSVQLFCSTAQDKNHMQEMVMIPVEA